MEPIKIPIPSRSSWYEPGGPDDKFEDQFKTAISPLLPEDWRRYAKVEMTLKNVIVTTFYPIKKRVKSYRRGTDFIIDDKLISFITESCQVGKAGEDANTEKRALRLKLSDYLRDSGLKEALDPNIGVAVMQEKSVYVEYKLGAIGVLSDPQSASRTIYPDGSISKTKLDIANITSYEALELCYHTMTMVNRALDNQIEIVLKHLPEWFWDKNQ